MTGNCRHWQLDPAGADSPLLTDLLASRLAGTGAAERVALELVAFAEPAGMRLLTSTARGIGSLVRSP